MINCLRSVCVSIPQNERPKFDYIDKIVYLSDLYVNGESGSFFAMQKYTKHTSH